MNLLKPENVADKLGISQSAFAGLQRREPSFPQPIKVTPKVFRWDEADIDTWLTNQKEEQHGKSERTG